MLNDFVSPVLLVKMWT